MQQIRFCHTQYAYTFARELQQRTKGFSISLSHGKRRGKSFSFTCKIDVKSSIDRVHSKQTHTPTLHPVTECSPGLYNAHTHTHTFPCPSYSILSNETTRTLTTREMLCIVHA